MNKLEVSYQVNERCACRALRFPRSSHRFQSVIGVSFGYTGGNRTGLRIRLRDLAASRVHYGYPRLYTLLRREGWQVNRKLVYRIDKEEGLPMRRKRPRRNRSCQVRVERAVAREAQ